METIEFFKSEKWRSVLNKWCCFLYKLNAVYASSIQIHLERRKIYFKRLHKVYHIVAKWCKQQSTNMYRTWHIGTEASCKSNVIIPDSEKSVKLIFTTHTIYLLISYSLFKKYERAYWSKQTYAVKQQKGCCNMCKYSGTVCANPPITG